MYQNGSKDLVLRFFLEFVESYLPLRKSRLATLGGVGLEASLWNQRGVAPENGALIESNRERSLQLISRFGYKYYNNLATFRRGLDSAVGKDKSAIDAFHLDLCGTFEPKTGIFSQILPLVLASKARCLAITVADQRRNRAVELRDAFFLIAKECIGPRRLRNFLERLRRQLESLRLSNARLDLEKAVNREFGLFFALSNMLSRGAPMFVPDRIERLVYISGSNSFRMRTYIFHFEPAGSVRDYPSLVNVMLQRWGNSRLQYIERGTVQRVVQQVMDQKEKEMSTYTALTEFMKNVSGQPKSEFESLLRDLRAAKSREAKALEFIGEVRSVLMKVEASVEKIKSAAGETGSAAGGRPPVKGDAPTERSTGNRRKKNGATLEAQMMMLQAEASSPDELQKAKKAAIKLLHLGRVKNRNNIIGGLLARTKGRHRGSFVARMAQGSDGNKLEGLLRALAEVYSQIPGEQKVTADELRKEAGL